jgi:hypothetical protein
VLVLRHLKDGEEGKGKEGDVDVSMCRCYDDVLGLRRGETVA